MRVCVVVTARASWAKLEPICRALLVDTTIELQIVTCASALLERYGNVSSVIERDYAITERVYSVVEGATLETSAIEAGQLQVALARTFSRLKPDLVVLCADRHEILAVAGAARMTETKILHCQGGEVTGSVDDDIRNAVTQLADYHCVCTKRAAMRVYALTGQMDRIHWTGCPSIDLAKEALNDPPVTTEELGGAGAAIDLSQPFAIVLQHPVTSEVDAAWNQMEMTLAGVSTTGLQGLVFWPGEDAGAEIMSKVIRLYQERFHTVRSLPPRRFLKLLMQAAVVAGNSSAGIREASYLGVPVVNVGTRQQGRERAANVVDVSHDLIAIRREVRRLSGQRFPSSHLYGSGDAGPRTAEIIHGIGVRIDTRAERQQGNTEQELEANR